MIICPSAHGILAVGSVAVAGGVTWNPSDKSSNTSLSNGNLTATGDGTAGAGQTRATASHSAGKYYFEVRLDAGPDSSNPFIGVRPAGNALGGSGPFDGGGDYGCFSRSPNDGHQDYQPGTLSAGFTGPALAVGDIYMIAIDLTASKLWIGVNGAWDVGGDPASGANARATLSSGETYAPWVAVSNNGTVTVTGRFASSDWTYSAPSGFGEW